MKSTIAFGWDSKKYHTHSYITKIALSQSNLNNLTANEIDLICKYSEKPDYDETGKAFNNHFFQYKEPIDKLSFNKFSKKTAIDSFLFHSSNAESLMKTNKPLALQELGRACHFLEDLSNPFHIATYGIIDSLKKLKKHVSFEKISGLNQVKFDLANTSLKNEKPNTLKDIYLNVQDYCTELAVKTAKTAYSYNYVMKEKQEGKYNLVAKDCLNLGVISTKQFLNKFFQTNRLEFNIKKNN